MVLVIFMIHLCTIATLMFVQNNTSQKILFIAARTIQFPGVVFKVCIYLIVCHRHLKYIFRCQKYPYLSKIYISAIIFQGLLYPLVVFSSLTRFLPHLMSERGQCPSDHESKEIRVFIFCNILFLQQLNNSMIRQSAISDPPLWFSHFLHFGT